MPAKNPDTTHLALQQLKRLGQVIRARRKALKVSATVAAESASMSRVTWHRVEKGEPSVTAGAYANALEVLGLTMTAAEPRAPPVPPGEGMIPALISLDQYPQLRQLAWHVTDQTQLTAREAFDIYQRNKRHLDKEALTGEEQQLLEALQAGFGTHEN